MPSQLALAPRWTGFLKRSRMFRNRLGRMKKLSSRKSFIENLERRDATGAMLPVSWATILDILEIKTEIPDGSDRLRAAKLGSGADDPLALHPQAFQHDANDFAKAIHHSTDDSLSRARQFQAMRDLAERVNQWNAAYGSNGPSPAIGSFSKSLESMNHWAALGFDPLGKPLDEPNKEEQPFGSGGGGGGADGGGGGGGQGSGAASDGTPHYATINPVSHDGAPSAPLTNPSENASGGGGGGGGGSGDLRNATNSSTNSTQADTQSAPAPAAANPIKAKDAASTPANNVSSTNANAPKPFSMELLKTGSTGGNFAPTITTAGQLSTRGDGRIYVTGITPAGAGMDSIDIYAVAGDTVAKLGNVDRTGDAFRGVVSGQLTPSTRLFAAAPQSSTMQDVSLSFSLNATSGALQDSDIDGVEDSLESLPGAGDRNQDGILDRNQANVVTIPDGRYGNLFTLSTDVGAFRDVQSLAPETSWDRIRLPAGAFGFQITSVPAGGIATVTMTPPAGVTYDRYWKWNSTSQNYTEFGFDGTTGALFDGGKIIVRLQDGGRGDADGLANGVIVDPSGPGTAPYNINGLTWTHAQSGGTLTGKSTFANNRMIEGNSFLSELRSSFVLPATTNALTLSFDVGFDRDGSGLINDAFEAAFLASDGQSLVPTIERNRDSFFNFTEGQSAIHNTNVLSSLTPLGNHTYRGSFSLDLSAYPAGMTGTLVLRLVNNDNPSGIDNATFLDISSSNAAPTAVVDTATAVEAGGLNNGTAGVNPTGNVLTNDTDPDAGDTKTVTAVNTLAGNVGASVTGTYGSINIGASGAFTYTVNNSNAAVQALRTTANTLTDVFSYTMADAGGLTSTTQVTITIQGANDTPVAVVDTAIADEAGGAGANLVPGVNPTGNVLTNDTDIDSGDTKTVTGVAAGVQASATGSVGLAVAGTFGSINIAAGGAFTYTVDNNNATVQSLRSSAETLSDVFTYTMADTGGLTRTTQITVTIRGVNDAPTLTSAATYTFPALTSGTVSTAASASAILTASAWADVDATPLSGLAIAAVTGAGTWQYSTDGTTWAAFGAVSSTAALLITSTTQIRYQRVGTTAETATFTYRAWDRTSGTASTNATPSYATTATNGGTSAFSAATGIASLNVGSVNQAPTAVTDTATAVEAGGLNNGTAGSNGTGNVLTNDTDPDAGDTKTVTAVNTLAGNVGASVTGTYGAINIGVNGAFTYTVNNSNAAVQALRTTANTLTDVFSYTMADAGGLTSTTQVTITIQGANDTPVAVVDTAIAVEAGGLNNGTAGSNGTGNVLTNDTDVDANGETKTVTAVNSVAGNVGASVTGTYGSINIGASGAFTYTVNNSNSAVQALRTTANTLTDVFSYTMADAGGLTSTTQVTITIQGANDTPVAVVDTATAVEAGGLNNGTAGSNGTGNVLTNDTDVDANGETKTVTAVNAVAGNVGASVTGTYGAINIAASGAFTYTVNNSNAAVQALRTTANILTDVFSYTMADAGGLTSTTQVTITIQGANDTPVAVVDTATAVEAGGLNNGTAGSNGTGNVLTNDTDVDANGETKTVTAVNSVAGNVGASVTGTYGSINIAASGAFTYTIDNNNATVQALRTTANTLTDVFSYTMADAGGLTSTTQVTITIQGANDTPVAVVDTAIANEAGGAGANLVPGVNPTGNVLTNDTDIDTGDTKTVTGVAAGVQASAAGSVGVAVTGAYGSINIAASGAFTYTVDNNNATVQALRTTADTLSDVFTYTMADAGSLTRTTQITVTIRGVNDAPTIASGATFTFSALTSGSLSTAVAASAVLTASSWADVDTTPLSGLAITAVTGTGTWQYSTDGTTWAAFGAVSSTAALLITSTTQIRYQRVGTTAETATFTYRAWDRTSGTASTNTTPGYATTATNGGTSAFSAATGTASVTATAANQAPTAVADTATAIEAGGLSNGTAGVNPTGNVLTNDTDPNVGDSKIVTAVNTVAGNVGVNVTGTYGSINIGAGGAFTYTVNNSNAAVQALRTTANTLTDVFSYTMADSGGLTSSAQVTVTIQGANDTPTAVMDAAIATEAGGAGTNLVAGVNPTGNVLTNDTDVDTGDTKTVTGVAAGVQASATGSVGVAVTGTYGSINISSAGAFTYTVNNNNATVQALRSNADTLSDVFTYTMADTGVLTRTTQITVTIRGVNDAPTIASAATYTFSALTLGNLSTAVAASTILTASSWADVDATPLSGLAITARTGAGTWQYSTDGVTWTSFGTVTSTAALLITSTTQIRYQRANSAAETATFTYRAWDRTTGTASTNATPRYATTATTGGTSAFSASSGTASLSVALNSPPVAVNDTYSVYDDDTQAGNLTLTIGASKGVIVNDSDPNPGTTLLATIGTNVTKGTLSFSNNGSFTYTPTAGATGWDSFTYTVSDGLATSNVATVTIFITGGIIPVTQDSYVELVMNGLEVDAGYDNELGMFIVENASGNMRNGSATTATAPGRTNGYANLAISHSSSRVILPRGYMSETKNIAGASRPARSYKVFVAAGSFISFYGIQNQTTDWWKANNSTNTISTTAYKQVAFFTQDIVNPDNISHFRTRIIGEGLYKYGMEDLLPSSAGVSGQSSDLDYDDLNFTIKLTPVGSPNNNVKFFVDNKEVGTSDSTTVDKVFFYNTDGRPTNAELTTGTGNNQSMGLTSNAAGDLLWSIDANKNIYRYSYAAATHARTLTGSWTPLQNTGAVLNNPTDIATDGTNIWVLDKNGASSRIYFYAGEATRTAAANVNANSGVIALDALNTDPSGLAVDATRLYVTDFTRREVFVYARGTGGLQGRWNLDPGNTQPTDITTEPTTTGFGTNLHVVDSKYGEIYTYKDATTWFSNGGHGLLVPRNSTWRYLQATAAPDDQSGTSWKQFSNAGVVYNDSTWSTGQGEIGYGDGEATTIPTSTSVTTYFRRTFNVNDKSLITGLKINLLRDDGAVVYINGVEVLRSNMPTGAVLHGTLATTATSNASESTYTATSLSGTALTAALNALTNGNNVISVEVHQDATTSDDLSFDLELEVGTQAPYFSMGANNWAYLVTPSAPVATWNDTGFDTTGWTTEQTAPLGYPTVGYGPDVNNKYRTTYFRREFTVNSSIPDGLNLQFQRSTDEGAVFYINGKEVARVNMEFTPVGYTTPSRKANYSFLSNDTIKISPSILKAGNNVLAIEVHKFALSGADSSELSINAGLSTYVPTFRMASGVTSLHLKKQANGNTIILNNAPQGIADPPPLNSPITWTGSAGGSWNSPGNWSAGRVPTVDDDVLINVLGGDYVITVDSPAQARNLYSVEKLKLVSGGNLYLSGPSEIDKLDLAGGQIDGPQTLIITTSLDWSAGSIAGSGGLDIATGAQVTVTGSATKLLGRNVTNAGTVIVGQQLQAFNTPTLINQTSGIMRFENGGGFPNDAVDIQNSGTVIKTGTVESKSLGLMTNNATGLVDIQQGNLRFGAGVSNSGEVRVSRGAQLLTVETSFEFSISSTGYVQTSGLTQLNGGTIDAFDPNDFGGTSFLNFTGGTLKGYGKLHGNVQSSTLVQVGNPVGQLTVDGNYTQLATGQLQIDWQGEKAWTGYDQLQVLGTVSLAGTVAVTRSTGVPIGDRMVLIDNDATDLISGSFSNATSSLTINGRAYQFNYAGQSGNDLVVQFNGPLASISNVGQSEDNANFVFTVTLSSPSAQSIVIPYTTVNRTAVAPADYQAVSSSITFAPGQLSKTITVTVAPDTVRENNEEFAVVLTAPANAGLLNATGVGTIWDEDGGLPIRDSRGKEFWLTFPSNLPAYTGKRDLQSLNLMVSSDRDTSGQVQIPGLGFSTNFTVTANQVTSISIPKAADSDSAMDIVANLGIRVTSQHEIVVYGLNYIPQSTDGYLALPVDALGMEYNLLTYKNIPYDLELEFFTEMAVVATQDNTVITVTPKADTIYRKLNVPFEVRLNAGETYQYSAQLSQTQYGLPNDISGTNISSNKPIAVFGGHQCANVPLDKAACDHLVEQIPPNETWGEQFLTLPLATRSGGDTVRVVASRDNTVISIDGQQVATIQEGQVYEQLIDKPSQIVTSQPALVAQFANGAEFDQNNLSDPFMMLIPTSQQFLSDYTFSTPATGYLINFVNVTVPAAAIPSLELDGQPVSPNLFTPIGNSGYFGAQLAIAVGSHHISASAPFGIHSYGFNDFDSYGFPGGMKLDPINVRPRIVIQTPSDKDQFPADSTILVSGRAIAGAPSAPIVAVYVNGEPVDIVDTAGNFFARVKVPLGLHEFEFTAVDSQGEQRSASITLQGMPLPTNLAVVSSLSDVSTIQTHYAVTSWNTAAKELHAQLVLENTGSYAVHAPFFVGVKNISDPSVIPVDIAGYTKEGIPYFDFSRTLTNQTLAAGASSLAGVLSFHVPNQTEFTYELVLLGQLNRAPRWESAPVTETTTGTTYSYALQANDPDGDDVQYRLLAGPPNLTLTGDNKLTWQPSAGQLGSYWVALEASDGYGGTSRQEYQLSVLAPSANTPPRFTSTPVVDGQINQAYLYDISATDADNDPITFSLTTSATGMRIVQTGASTAQLHWLPATGQNVVQPVTIVATAGPHSTSQSYAIAVQPVTINRAPSITSKPVTAWRAGSTYNYTVVASDPDNTPLQYSLDSQSVALGMTISPAGQVQWPNPQIGSYPISITVSDTQLSDVQTYTLEVLAAGSNRPPVITSSFPAQVRLGMTMTQRVVAVDPDQDNVTYSLLVQSGGMTIDPITGWITWTPTVDQLGVNSFLVVQASDGLGTDVKSYFPLVVTSPGNHAPQFTTTPDTNVIVSKGFLYATKAEDTDGDTLTYKLIDSPLGMTIDADTGLVRWSPTANQVGQHPMKIRVTDARGAYSEQSTTLNVISLNRPPIITSAPATTATLSRSYAYAVEAEDPDGHKLTYSLNSATTATGALQIDAESGLLRWVPNALGSQHIQIDVTDELGLTSSQIFDILVSLPANNAPVITTTPALEAEVGVLYKYDLDARDPDGDTVSYQVIVPASLPNNMQFNSATGMLTWTPTLADVNQLISFGLRASDGPAASTQYFSVAVSEANIPPQIAFIPDGTVLGGATYRYDVEATDQNGDALTYSLDRDSVSQGWSIDQNGRITKTTIPVFSSLSYPLTVTVSDGKATASRSFAVTIAPDFQAPVVTIISSNNQPKVDDELTLKVHTIEDVGILDRTLVLTSVTKNGLETPLNQNIQLDGQGQGRLKITPALIGTLKFNAKVTDLSRNIGTAPELAIQVADPASVQPPTAQLAINATSTVTAPLNVVATINDDLPAGLTWDLVMTDDESGAQKVLVPNGTGAINNQVIAQIDPTFLRNSQYTLRLTARDSANNQAQDSSSLNVEGGLKMGNFAIGFTDMTVPVAGVPITITRSYDSLDADVLGDFGYGWKLDIQSTKLQVQMDPNRAADFGGNKPFKNGDRVVVTLADGTKHGFTFFAQGVGQLGIITHYIPTFLPDSGIKSKLIVGSTTLREAGDYFLDLESPNGYLYGTKSSSAYELQLRNGSKLLINAKEGDLDEINDRNGNVTKFVRNANGDVVEIASSSGRSVVIDRDTSGRIVKITDPRGKQLSYTYTYAGDLSSFTNRVGAVTQFTYLATPKHFLDTVIDPLGRTAVNADYSPTGRVQKIKGASGSEVNLTYDVATRTETMTDPVGKVYTQVKDAQGNVVREVDPTGVITKRTFITRDGLELLLSETQVVGAEDGANGNTETNDLTTTNTYNDKGDLTEVADVYGNKTLSTFNSYGQPTSQTDPFGNSTNNFYDATTGNLKFTSDNFGNTTSMGFDASGNVTSSRDRNGNLQFSAVYSSFGEITSVTPGQGRSAEVAYDASGNAIARWSFDGLGASQVQLLSITSFDDEGKATGSVSAKLPAGQFITTGFETASIPAQYQISSSATMFNAVGQAVATTDANGLINETTYDINGRVVQSRSQTRRATPTGDQIVWSRTRTVYDAAGRVVAQTESIIEGSTDPVRGTRTVYDDAGRVLQTYQTLGMVIDLVGPNANVLEAQLTSAGTTLANTTTTSHYDSAGRVDLTADSYGRTTATTYNAQGNVTQTRTQTYDENSNLKYLVTRTFYDSFGRSVLSTDAYIEGAAAPIFGSRSLYDNLGRAIGSERRQGVVINLTGNETSIGSLGSLISQTSTEFDAQGRAYKQTSSDGQISTTEFDSRGRVVATLGMHVPVALVGLTAPSGATHARLRSETVYDLQGRAYQSITGIIEWGSIVAGQFVRATNPDGSPKFDRTNQRVTEQVYDDQGRVTQTIAPDGTFTRTEYDLKGRVQAEIDQLGNRKDFTYNSSGQLSSVALPEVLNPTTNSLARPTYQYEYNEFGQMSKLIDANGSTTNFGITSIGQSSIRTLPDGQFETFSYDNRQRQTVHKSFEGVHKVTVYDDTPSGAGRVIGYDLFVSQQDYDNFVATGALALGVNWERIRMTYDAFGRLLTTTHIYAAGAGLNAAGQPSQVVRTDNWTNSYDDQGRLVQETSPSGVIGYEYDPLGRKSRTWAGGVGATASTAVSDVVYDYDQLGRLATVSTVKRDKVVVDSDPAVPNAQPETTTYHYDLLGRPDFTSMPNAVVEDFAFDNMDRLDVMRHLSSGVVKDSFDYSYRADGKRTGMVETFNLGGSDKTTSYTWNYDNAGRLTSEAVDHWQGSNTPADPSDDTLDQTESYLMDLVGNRIRRTIDKVGTAGDVTDIYTYDASDRLRSENRYAGLFLTGTPAGAPAQSTGYTWNLTQQSSKTVSGPTIATVVQAMTYGLTGQLEKVITTTSNGSAVQSRSQVEYRYDSSGIRFISIETTDTDLNSPEVNGPITSKTEYLIDHANFTGYAQTIIETTKNANDQATKRISYTFGSDEITQTTSDLDPLTGNVTSSTTYTFGHDGHGSTRALYAAAGALIQVFTYSAYGELLAIYNGSGTVQTLTSNLTNILYNGESIDGRTGMYNFRARWYSAGNGRFERLDPFAGDVDNPFSFNKYGFVYGDPIMLSDPSGLDGLIGLVSGIGIRIGNFAMSNPATFGAIQGGLIGFFDGLAEDGDLGDAVYAAGWGAAFGFVGGRVLGGVAARLGPWLRKLHPETGVRLLYGMFAVNLALTGYGVYTAKSGGQAGFRAALGIMGLVANGAVIAKVTQWAKKLRDVDTLVLASTSTETSVGTVSTVGKNVLRNNKFADELGEIGESIALEADQADLPLPKEIFTTIVGRNVQVERDNALKTFNEWFRVMKQGGKIEVSISTSFISAQEVIDGLSQAGFRNALQLSGYTAPHGLRFSAIK